MIQKDVELAFGMIHLVICFPCVSLIRKKSFSFPGEVIKGDFIFHINVTSKQTYKKKKKCLNKSKG